MDLHNTKQGYASQVLKTSGSPIARRKKLWELDRHFHCPIIGSCLTDKELKKILRKTYDKSENNDPFIVHSACVQAAREKNETSKAIHKLLDRKYQQAIRSFYKAGSEQEVESLWNQAWEAGEFQGAFWAVMTHPQSGDELLMRVFGHMHMLGHDLIQDKVWARQQQQQQEQRIAHLQDRLKKQKKVYTKALQEKASRIRALEQEIASTKAEIQRWKRLDEEAGLQPEQIEDILAQNIALNSELQQLKKHQADMEDQIFRMHKKHGALKASQAKSQKRLQYEKEYVQLLEEELLQYQTTFGPLNCPDRGTERCPGPSLCGRRVLYVGGVKSMVPHYRKLVENHGGKFLYHDGGNENSAASLPELASKADTVVCAMNCVSHGAAKMVKERCKQHDRQCLFLRTSSLSCLNRGLRDIQNHN
ncbi:MAG: DUF2325 domain-containing protein [Desulfohalobiaceae bacterium]